jgi:hypothetical protein
MPRSHGTATLLGLLLVLPAAGMAAAPPAGPARRSYSGTAQVTAVEVPVQVLRDDEPVRGLTAADFEIT